MDFLVSLLNSMPGAVAQGLIWGIMAIGVYITYQILDVADLTVDGSLGTGGAVCVMLTISGAPIPGWPCCAPSGRHAGGPGDGPVPHRLRHPGHPGRHSDPAGPLLRQPADHGLGTGGGKANQPVSVDKYDLLVSCAVCPGSWG